MVSADEALEAFRTSLRSGDLDSVFKWIADDALFIFSNGHSHDGKSAVRAAFEHNAQVIKNDTYDISDVRWLVQSEEFAVCVYQFAWTGQINGKAASGSGRGTTVLHCLNGAWKIIHEHLSKGLLSD